VSSRALDNNGRSEDETVLDYFTTALLALLPCLHGCDRTDLDVGVIGLGAGVTTGIRGAAEDIRRVRVVEISTTVLKTVTLFDESDYDLDSNRKIEMIAADGFTYLARPQERLDLLISGPSVPWVVGMENLFTPEYYRLARRSLSDDDISVE
jgi:spermidine synthase